MLAGLKLHIKKLFPEQLKLRANTFANLEVAVNTAMSGFGLNQKNGEAVLNLLMRLGVALFLKSLLILPRRASRKLWIRGCWLVFLWLIYKLRSMMVLTTRLILRKLLSKSRELWLSR